MRAYLLFTFITVAALSSGLRAQFNVDSLKAILESNVHDSVRANTLSALINAVGPTEEGIAYNNQFMEVGKRMISNKDSATANAGKKYYAAALGNSGYLEEQSGNISQALAYYEESLALLRATNAFEDLASVYNNIAVVYDGLGDIPNAIAYNDSALAIRKKYGFLVGLASSYNNLGTIYRDQGEYEKALENFQRFYDICITLKDSSGIGLALNNIGNLHMMKGDTASGRNFLEQGLAVNKAYKYPRGIGHSLYGLGTLKSKSGDFKGALVYYEEALRYQTEGGHKSGMVSTMLSIAEMHSALNDNQRALKIASEAHEIAVKIGYVSLIENSARVSKELYRKTGQFELALKMHELEVQMRDSLINETNRKIIIRNELEYEYNKKADELQAAKEKAELATEKNATIRNIALTGLGIMCVLLFLVVSQRNRISRERKRSDDLLLNILPSEVAEELKEKGHAETKSFDEVTILFTDFKGFTLAAEKLPAKELVEELDTCFKAFDSIVDKYGIEKIKTIGDSYMAVGGIPAANSTHATDVTAAALEIRDFMIRHSEELRSKGKETFEIRIGIHTGPVVAGIVGVKKFAYDIWGDTVNTASRMESSGEHGKVNVSETTYQHIRNSFSCSYRGKVAAKNKGEISMYFVDGKIAK